MSKLTKRKHNHVHYFHLCFNFDHRLRFCSCYSLYSVLRDLQ
nr:MAG TPA: hypothetical protein [Caudoviricetes sp.]